MNECEDIYVSPKFDFTDGWTREEFVKFLLEACDVLTINDIDYDMKVKH